MAEAKLGQRVADRLGHAGTIVEVRRNQVTVAWDGGEETDVLASQIYPIGDRRWIFYVAFALSLGLSITLLAWLL